MEFKTPLLLLLVPAGLVLLWQLRHRRRSSGFNYSSVKLAEVDETWKTKMSFVPTALRLLAVALVCVALAGPRKVLEESKVATEGIDIVLALDCSGSMLAEDFEINGHRLSRFEIIKRVVNEFIKKRTSDQVALVGFAGRAYTVCPLTTDHQWLLANLERMKVGMMEDGTAIGSGIATSAGRFKDSKAKSKVIIVLTDGVNNAGSVDPITAARTAAALGVKIYTIGAGAQGFAPYPRTNLLGQTFYQNIPTDLDEATLKKIAILTGGQFFRAVDTQSLRNIYASIDRLEKSKIEHVGYKQYRELFGYFLVLALAALALEILLSNFVFLRLP